MGRPVDNRVEADILVACQSGDFAAATTAALRAHGPEIFGLLIALHKDPDAADDAFSLFSERLWQALPSFEWRCSLRTWVYCLARNASTDLQRRAHRRQRREIALSTSAGYDELRAQVRTATLSMLRTARRAELEKLRDELPGEDRMILILRVDRDLPWRDVAMVLAGATSDDEATLAQETARLRKRFQIVRERLREAAKSRGLI